MKTIDIIIAPTGASRLETKGFAGSDCQEASRLIEAALGNVTSKTMTAEFHEARAEQQDHLNEET